MFYSVLLLYFPLIVLNQCIKNILWENKGMIFNRIISEKFASKAKLNEIRLISRERSWYEKYLTPMILIENNQVLSYFENIIN